MHSKNVFLLLAIGYSIALAIICLVPDDGLPYFGTNYEDKIYHVLAYALLCFLWYKALKQFKIRYAIGISFITTIVYGIIIEVLQGQLTDTRDASIMDIVANSAGVAIVSLILTLRNKTSVKKI